MTDVSKMTDDYIKSLEALGSSDSTVPTPTSYLKNNSLLASIYAQQSATHAPQTFGAASTPPSSSGPSEGFWSKVGHLASGALDVALRPLYATSNVITSEVANIEKNGFLQGMLHSDNSAQATPEQIAQWRKEGKNVLADEAEKHHKLGDALTAAQRGIYGEQKGLPENYTKDIVLPDWLEGNPAKAAVPVDPSRPHISAMKTPWGGTPVGSPVRATMNLGLGIATDPLTFANPVKGASALVEAIKPAEKVIQEVAEGAPGCLATPKGAPAPVAAPPVVPTESGVSALEAQAAADQAFRENSKLPPMPAVAPAAPTIQEVRRLQQIAGELGRKVKEAGRKATPEAKAEADAAFKKYRDAKAVGDNTATPAEPTVTPTTPPHLLRLSQHCKNNLKQTKLILKQLRLK